MIRIDPNTSALFQDKTYVTCRNHDGDSGRMLELEERDHVSDIKEREV